MLFVMRHLKWLAPVLIVAICASGAYALGVRLTEAEFERELLKSREKQDALVEKLDKATKQLRNRKAADVKTIYVEKDSTGCADTIVPDGMLNAITND